MRQIGSRERMAIYDELQRGKPVTQIYWETGYTRGTIRKIKASGEPGVETSTLARSRRPSLLEPYQDYIRERVQLLLNGKSNSYLRITSFFQKYIKKYWGKISI